MADAIAGDSISSRGTSRRDGVVIFFSVILDDSGSDAAAVATAGDPQFSNKGRRGGSEFG
jgi:hypothetical protein